MRRLLALFAAAATTFLPAICASGSGGGSYGGDGSGETRSLMKEISHELTKDQESFSSLKLMLVYRNRDKVVADSLGATEGTTIVCYRNAMPYKYQGRLRTQSILSSVSYLMSLAPEELPLQKLDTFDKFEMFLASADKVVLLRESCGWTEKLLAQARGNESVPGRLFLTLSRETNGTPASTGQKNLKDAGNHVLTCGVEKGFPGIPWAGDFSSGNGTAHCRNEERPSVEITCSSEEYKKFESFLLKFMAIARDQFLPPQRQRYGLVSDKTLLSSLNIEESGPWSLIVSYAGCPGCSKVLKDENDLHEVAEMHYLPVMELVNNQNEVGPELPANKPSVILFVDRSSDSIEIQSRSNEALGVFREVALQYQNLYGIGGQNTDGHRISSVQAYRASKDRYKDHRMLLSPSRQKMKFADKMSVMIINDGKHVKLGDVGQDLQASSLHEILTNLLGRKKQAKLSSLAKEAGFQLLSGDLDIKILDSSSSQSGSQSPPSTEHLNEVPIESAILSSQSESQRWPSTEHSNEVPDKSAILSSQSESQSIVSSQSKCQSQPSTEHSDEVPNEIALDVAEDQGSKSSSLKLQTGPIEPHHEDVNLERITFVHGDKLGDLHRDSRDFTMSFLFSDCDYQLLGSLANDSRVPAMVIIDPLSQQHYVLSDLANFSPVDITSFIDGFSKGNLSPYQRSGPVQIVSEGPHPPFINLDFREKDSIPHVTTQMFSELVIGSSQLNVKNESNAWHKDVLVLFSSSWCGFCQRMELVVREAFRAFKGYMNTIKDESKDRKFVISNENSDDTAKVPAIYLIDCTLNECSWILKSFGQREMYPNLVLFPAERKNAVPYKGDLMVNDIIKFLGNHGSTSHYLLTHKGILWTETEEKVKDPFPSDVTLLTESYEESSDDHYRSLTKNQKDQNQIKYNGQTAARYNVVVGSFLIATELLSGTNPFSNTQILIVGLDPSLGFNGLILNKRISWESVPGIIQASVLKDAPLSFGGPVIHGEAPLIALTRKSLENKHPEVLPGVYFLDQIETVHVIEKVKAGNESSGNYWFFFGYSGWGWEQLFGEIDEGAWILQHGSVEGLPWP